MTRRKTLTALSHSNRYPIDGTAARKYNPSRQRKRVQRKIERKIKQKEVQRRNYSEVPSLIVMFIAVTVSLFMCFTYIKLQTTVTYRLEDIKEKEKKLENMKAENDELEASLNKVEDLEKIKKIAIQELGMIYPDSDRVIYYTKTETGYVRQYDEIPD